MMIPGLLLQGSFYERQARRMTKAMKPPPIPKMDIEPCSRGDFVISRFKISTRDAIDFNTHHLANGHASRFILPGTYTRLMEKREEGEIQEDGKKWIIWMSDTPAELNDHLEVYNRATGRVLIHGLGLGVIVNALILKSEVSEIEVWEIDEDLIKLVGPHLRAKAKEHGTKLKIVHGDVWQHRPAKGVRWDVVWHDIWPGLGGDNLKPMQKLCARFRSRCEWQECWARDVCRDMAKEARNEERRGGFRW